jgi:DNA primase
MKKIEQIKLLPISTIISRYVVLNSRGISLVGICPFHSDTKPALNVSDHKNLFKCFVCGMDGDGISFVMNFEQLPFADAIEKIIKDHNLSDDSTKGK